MRELDFTASKGNTSLGFESKMTLNHPNICLMWKVLKFFKNQIKNYNIIATKKALI
jgi:hypothetical protein